MTLFSVPFKREVVDIFQVEARSRTEATMKATEMRLQGLAPTHRHEVKFTLGKVEATIVDDPAPADDVV